MENKTKVIEFIDQVEKRFDFVLLTERLDECLILLKGLLWISSALAGDAGGKSQSLLGDRYFNTISSIHSAKSLGL